jgi:ethanolamine utilization microcompartment shell protein EutS
LPDIVPAKLENVTRGTTFKFENVTVTDALGNIYKALAVDQNNTNDLGHQLTNLNLGSNSSRLVTKVIGNDPTLGQIELMEISMGTYVLPIANIGTADAKIPFTNRFTGNMVTGSIKLPTKEDLKQKIAFPFTSTFDYVLPSLATGITNNCVVNKANIQVFTFSNRPLNFIATIVGLLNHRWS